MRQVKAEPVSGGTGAPRLHAARIATPVGTLLVVVNHAGAATHVVFDGDRSDEEMEGALGVEAGTVAWEDGRCEPVLTQLREYFAGRREDFDVPVAPAGSPFEQKVWASLTRIPYGTTTSYGAIAKGLGTPNLSRAVGRANGANPVPILVPCHRVIGASGKLVGFGGGLWRKEVLLKLEGALLV